MEIDVEKLNRSEKKAYDLEQIDALVEQNEGIVKTADILDLGIDYRRILFFVEEGDLIRLKSGYYTTKYYDSDEETMIANLFEDGVLTLASALYYYGYLPQRPRQWDIAVGKNVSKSRFNLSYPQVIPHYCEQSVLNLGVKEIALGNKTMKIFEKERIICDCLKYQDQMNRDDFKRGIISYIGDSNKDIPKLLEYARKRRVVGKVQSMIGVWL